MRGRGIYFGFYVAGTDVGGTRRARQQYPQYQQ